MAKLCKICKSPNQNPMAQVCSPKCALEYAKNKRVKTQRKEARSELTRMKRNTRSEMLKLAQKAFNAYIRARDEKNPCISCGRHHQGQYHAGHYRSVGANPELRFNELNAHKQCQPCNTHLSGNLINYRINLIKKIGLVEVEKLEGNHQPMKYTVEQLQEIEKEYKEKLKELTGKTTSIK